MPKQISMNAAARFRNGLTFGRSNTSVIVDDEHVTLTLFGNPIARYAIGTDNVEIKIGRWNTITTRDRLNAVLIEYGQDFSVVQRDFSGYFAQFDRFYECEHLISVSDSWESLTSINERFAQSRAKVDQLHRQSQQVA